MSEYIHLVCPHCESLNRLPVSKRHESGQCGKCHKPLFTGSPVDLSSKNFSRYISKNDIPVVVDFWAPWCGPCKMMAPVFNQAAQQLQPQVQVAKVNTETEQSLAMQYQVRSIPTIAIFKAGKEIARTAGAMDITNLVSWIKQNHSL